MAQTHERDVLTLIASHISNNWKSDNTYNRTPVIKKIFDPPIRIDLAKKDYVLLYQLGEEITPMGVGYPAEQIRTRLAIDIRNIRQPESDMDGRKLLYADKAEVRRTLAMSDGSADATYYPRPWQLIIPVSWEDISNKKVHLFHGVMEVDVIHYAQKIDRSGL
jgi:hypothetical protein